MAIGQILKFSGVGIDKYDAVQKELGWTGETGKPEVTRFDVHWSYVAS